MPGESRSDKGKGKKRKKKIRKHTRRTPLSSRSLRLLWIERPDVLSLAPDVPASLFLDVVIRWFMNTNTKI
jgi:hypothetical protein